MHINYLISYIKPVSRLRSVVLPAPEGPIMAVNSPDLNFPETPFRICFLPEKIKQILDTTV